MGYEYKDEQIPEPSGLSPEELKKQIKELEIKNYGHVLPKALGELKKPKRKTIYSVKKKCFVYKDTREPVHIYRR